MSWANAFEMSVPGREGGAMNLVQTERVAPRRSGNFEFQLLIPRPPKTATLSGANLASTLTEVQLYGFDSVLNELSLSLIRAHSLHG